MRTNMDFFLSRIRYFWEEAFDKLSGPVAPCALGALRFRHEAGVPSGAVYAQVMILQPCVA